MTTTPARPAAAERDAARDSAAARLRPAARVEYAALATAVVDAQAARSRDEEFDKMRPSSAWLDAQIALSAITGRDEQRLWDIYMYTDDIVFEAVGCELLVHVVMRSWYNLIREINARMASALKRHGGAAALWLGINHLATLGFATIPVTKRLAATAVLDDLVAAGRCRSRNTTSCEDSSCTSAFTSACAHVHIHKPASEARKKAAPERSSSPRTTTCCARCAGASCSAHRRRVDGCGGGRARNQHRRPLGSRSTDAAKNSAACRALPRRHLGDTLRDDDVRGRYQISIPVLEMAAVVVNVMVFGAAQRDAAHHVRQHCLRRRDRRRPARAARQWLRGLLLGDQDAPSDTDGDGRAPLRSYERHQRRDRGYGASWLRCRRSSMKYRPVAVPQRALDVVDELRAERLIVDWPRSTPVRATGAHDARAAPRQAQPQQQQRRRTDCAAPSDGTSRSRRRRQRARARPLPRRLAPAAPLDAARRSARAFRSRA